jgi:hypothetical protein
MSIEGILSGIYLKRNPMSGAVGRVWEGSYSPKNENSWR